MENIYVKKLRMSPLSSVRTSLTLISNLLSQPEFTPPYFGFTYPYLKFTHLNSEFTHLHFDITDL